MSENLDAMAILNGAGNQATKALQRAADRADACGLTLSPGALQGLAERQNQALRDTGRVSVGPGAAARIVESFCDSPYLPREGAEEALADLVDSFYYFKNESDDEISDDELLEMMRRYFDEVCRGGMERMRGTTLTDLKASAWAGYGDDPNADWL